MAREAVLAQDRPHVFVVRDFWRRRCGGLGFLGRPNAGRKQRRGDKSNNLTKLEQHACLSQDGEETTEDTNYTKGDAELTFQSFSCLLCILWSPIHCGRLNTCPTSG